MFSPRHTDHEFKRVPTRDDMPRHPFIVSFMEMQYIMFSMDSNKRDVMLSLKQQNNFIERLGLNGFPRTYRHKIT
jgi:hypothetical protein